MLFEICRSNITIIILLVILKFLSVNGEHDEYDELISRADIFYVDPEPNSDPATIRISELSKVTNRTNIKIIIHGYTAHKDHVAIQPLRFAYLHKGHNALYMADYRDAANIFYLTSRYFVHRIGQHFGKILHEFMKKHQISPNDVHLIGHSLGSHIAGTIGLYFKGKIGRITGLDPAGPLFDENSYDGLKSSNALFVDCIHSGSPTLGALTRRGHVDFYPNYGQISQPGCGTLDWLVITTCSHFRAPLFYAESILLPNSFTAINCSLENIQKYNCKQNRLSKMAIMGENIDQKLRGTFYLITNNVPPYGMGLFSKIVSQRYINNNETMAIGAENEKK